MIREIASLNITLARIAEVKSRIDRLRAPGRSFSEVMKACASVPTRALDPALENTIARASAECNLEPALIKAVAQAESGFNPLAVSRVGAQGVMQLMPATAQALGVDNPFDPHQSIMAGSRYLRQMLDRNNGNTALALASYNAGPNAVERYGGIPPYPETQRYVQNVLALFERYRK